jgi:GTP cyclohydrolase I
VRALLTILQLPAVSMCEHHLLPFYGVAHVAYRRAPGGARLPRGALQALVDHCARRLQVQERLTRQLAEAVSAATGAAGVMVVTEAAHMCMASRGVEKTASSTCSTATLGCFAAEPAERARFLASLRAARGAAAAAACGCAGGATGAGASGRACGSGVAGARTPPWTVSALAR